MPDTLFTHRLSVEGADPLLLTGVNDVNLNELAKLTAVRVDGGRREVVQVRCEQAQQPG